uniref:Uncharacterized protein n=1 Tax=Moniliophthora roreri TaxID=221103 RepID=A0A0W0FW82_MONRR
MSVNKENVQSPSAAIRSGGKRCDKACSSFLILLLRQDPKSFVEIPRRFARLVPERDPSFPIPASAPQKSLLQCENEALSALLCQMKQNTSEETRIRQESIRRDNAALNAVLHDLQRGRPAAKTQHANAELNAILHEMKNNERERANLALAAILRDLKANELQGDPIGKRF